MRISCSLDDPGFSPICYKFDIYLNGDLINHCVTADEEEGYVLVYRINQSGRYETNDAGTEILKDLLVGKVQILKSDNYL